MKVESSQLIPQKLANLDLLMADFQNFGIQMKEKH